MSTSEARAAIRAADEELVAALPILGWDEAVAGALFLGAVGGYGLLCGAWLTGLVSGLLPGLGVVLGLTLLLSVLHELEHDLIHDLYLRNPVVRMVVLLTIWVAKGSLDPWTRGHMHRWHHIVSGQQEDIEERLIGLGTPWGPFRVALTLWAPLAIVLQPSIRRAVRARVKEGGRGPDPRAYTNPPYLMLGNALLMLAPLAAVAGLALGAAWAWPLILLWVLPNMLRHSTIVTMSSNSHYVDIQPGQVSDQNQILDHWLFWPLQVFCWNFGATHVLHHLVVRQPFWRRTLVSPRVRQALVDAGIRANDLGTFRRANRHPGPTLG